MTASALAFRRHSHNNHMERIDAMMTTSRDTLRSCFFFVEATGYEQMSLYREAMIAYRVIRPGEKPAPITWQQEPIGFAEIVGHVGDLPVSVAFSFVRIEGQRVAFYEPTSRMVDHDLVYAWLDALPMPRHHDRVARTDAMNFHHCLHAIENAATR